MQLWYAAYSGEPGYRCTRVFIVFSTRAPPLSIISVDSLRSFSMRPDLIKLQILADARPIIRKLAVTLDGAELTVKDMIASVSYCYFSSFNRNSELLSYPDLSFMLLSQPCLLLIFFPLF